jgi:hypothetical protein
MTSKRDGMNTDNLFDNPGPVIAYSIFGSFPWYTKLRLPRRARQWLQELAWKRNKFSVQLLFHPETRDHIAVVNGVTLQLPSMESEYPRFIGLDFSTARRARKLYPRVKNADLTDYQTIVTHGNGVGFRFPMPDNT